MRLRLTATCWYWRLYCSAAPRRSASGTRPPGSGLPSASRLKIAHRSSVLSRTSPGLAGGGRLAWARGLLSRVLGGRPAHRVRRGRLPRVCTGWANQLNFATDSATKNIHPILISLDKAATHATESATAASAIVLGVSGLWVVVGLEAGAAASWGKRSRDGFAVLAHVSLLVLGPVAVNPYLEPYPSRCARGAGGAVARCHRGHPPTGPRAGGCPRPASRWAWGF